MGSHPHARPQSVSTTPATGPSSSIQKMWSIASECRGVRHHHCRSAASHTPASASARRARCSSSVASARYSGPEARTSWIAMRRSYERPGSAVLPFSMCEHMFVLGAATILHADLDAFYASVEQRDDPRLRGRPVIVGAGVVLAASYEAKACGCAPRWAAGEARRLCPSADRRPAADVGLRRGEQGGLSRLRGQLAARRRAVDRRGVPRRSRARADLGHAYRDRRAAATRRARTRRPADHRGRREDEVPRQGGEWRRQARRPARRASRRRAERFSTRCRSSVSGASGPATARKLHERRISTVGEVARLARPCS